MNTVTLVSNQSGQIEIEGILALNSCGVRLIHDSFNFLAEFVHNEINTYLVGPS